MRGCSATLKCCEYINIDDPDSESNGRSCVNGICKRCINDKDTNKASMTVRGLELCIDQYKLAG